METEYKHAHADLNANLNFGFTSCRNSWTMRYVVVEDYKLIQTPKNLQCPMQTHN